jgi:hypothetical protein
VVPPTAARALARGGSGVSSDARPKSAAAQLEDIGYGIQKLRIMVQVRASTI